MSDLDDNLNKAYSALANRGLLGVAERLRASVDAIRAEGRRQGVEEAAKWAEADSGTWIAERMRRALLSQPAPKCAVRVWDNGDCRDCDRPRPCPHHEAQPAPPEPAAVEETCARCAHRKSDHGEFGCSVHVGLQTELCVCRSFAGVRR